MQHWILVLIAIGLLAIHERLSASKYWFLGGVLPLAGVVGLVYQFGFANVERSTRIVIAYVVFFVTTSLSWLIGRYERKCTELKRMKAKDI